MRGSLIRALSFRNACPRAMVSVGTIQVPLRTKRWKSGWQSAGS
jgi:hypothetical protein